MSGVYGILMSFVPSWGVDTCVPISAAQEIEDPRLVAVNTVGQKLVFFYAIYLVFYTQVFWETQSVVPVSQSGRLHPALRKSYGGLYRPSKACMQEQNQHCGIAKNWDAPISHQPTLTPAG